jgi:hypothetical protein
MKGKPCRNVHRYTRTGEETPSGYEKARCDICGRITTLNGTGAIWPHPVRLRSHNEPATNQSTSTEGMDNG